MKYSRSALKAVCVSAVCALLFTASAADAAFWRSGLWVMEPRGPQTDLFSVSFNVNRTDLAELKIGGAPLTCTDSLGTYDWTVTLSASETQSFYINNGHIDGAFTVAGGAYEGLYVAMVGDLHGSTGELSITIIQEDELARCELTSYFIDVRRVGIFRRILDFLQGQ